MKRVASKISIAFVCALLGFMLTHQFKVMNSKTSDGSINQNSADIIHQNEQLTKQKEEYEEKLKAVESKLSQYENATASRTDESKILLQQLEQLRNVNGATELVGEGITIYITPKSSIINANYQGHYIQDLDLVDIVNELYAGQAEAISINDIRLLGKSGIRTAGNAIIIGNERISPYKPVVIKAIGKKELLESAVNFVGSIPETLTNTCDVKSEVSNEVRIPKSNTPVEDFKYAKPVAK